MAEGNKLIDEVERFRKGNVDPALEELAESNCSESASSSQEQSGIHPGRCRSWSEQLGRDKKYWPESSVRSGNGVNIVKNRLAAVLMDGIEKAVVQLTQCALSKHEIARRVLQGEYEGKLGQDELVKAAILLEN